MQQVTLKKAQRDLQSLLNDAGSSDFPRVKALYLKDVQVVDSAGESVDPDTLDIMIALPDGAEVVEDESGVTPKAEGLEEEEEEEEENGKSISASMVAAIVRKELAKAPNQKAQSMVKVKDTAMGHKTSSIRNFKSDESAYRFGRWCFAAYGHAKSAMWCRDNGIQLKGHTEGVNTAGGYLVPDEFSATLIDLREEYGVARQHAHIEPMSSDVKRIPRRSAGLTAYWTGEAAAITESTSTFDQVNLVAKKLAVITTVSNELNEDSLINLGDFLAGEISYQFAYKEDLAAFLGTGTSAFGGITGIQTNLGAAGQTDAAGDQPGDVTIANVTDAMALLPDYADNPNTKWFMNRQTWSAAFQRIAYSAGGNDPSSHSASMPQSLFGYPVVFTNVMEKADTDWVDGEAIALFGDMSKVCYFGDRRQTSIQFSDSALNAFEQDELVVRGTERVDIVTTNLGDGTNAGAMVGLMSPA